MNRKLLKVFTTLSMLSLVVSGCGKDKNSDSSNPSSAPESSVVSSSQTSNSTLPSTSSEESHPSDEPSIPSVSESSLISSESSNSDVSSPSESSEPEKEVYKILVNKHANSQVVLSQTEACAGDVITLTITPDEGYKVDKIEVNGVEITSTSFTMPETSAVVNVYTSLVDKDGYIIDGDVSAKLVEENGIYVARNVAIAADSFVTFKVDGEEISVTKINNKKTFANLDIRVSTKDHKGGFTIKGNAIYDFFYDPADLSTPCYVQRVGIIDLPSNETMVADLFGGSVKSETTVNPQNVNKVEYTSSARNEHYEWNLYSDNSSYASITSTITNQEKAIVYKAQVGNVYKVVDNYIEGGQGSTYVTKDDTSAYSGQYDIVAAVSKHKYQRLQSEVDEDVNSYSHTMEALDAEFYQAFRNSYVGNIYNDVTVEHGQNVESERLDNGDFTVNLATWVRWDQSTVYASSTGYASAYVTYNLDLTFTAAGAIRTGHFTETFYGTDYYDFYSKTLKPGYESVDPKRDITVSYFYGEPLAGQPDVDVSRYFTQSISDVVLTSKNVDQEGCVAIGDDIKASATTLADKSHNLTFVCNPATALDMWQYGPVSSSDYTVVGPRNSSYPDEYRAFRVGEATITIGNHTANANTVTAQKKVTVADVAYVKGIFMYTVGGYNNYDETFFANTGSVVCGNVYELQLAASTTSGSYAMNSLGLTLEVTQNEGLLDFKYDEKTGVLTIDATNANVTEKTTVKLVATSQYLVDGWPTSSFTYYVLPREEFADSIVGTWTSDKVESYIEVTSNTNGVIHYVNKGKETLYDFSYTYDSKTGKVNITSKPVISGSTVYLYMYIDSEDNALCVCFASEKNWSDEVVDYIGSYYYDEYEWEYIIYYEPFFKA